ncbi:MAG: class I SAM-dependent methyltransferase [Actinomycetota bacterium]
MLLRSEVAGTAGRIGGHCVTASDHNDRDGVPGSGGHWFEAVADHLGPAYLKYSFTRGTAAEVDGVIDLVELAPGAAVLDVGCGPGRHALEFAERGYAVTGVDISRTFIDLATAEADRRGLGGAARFHVGDARALDVGDGFDLAFSLCQGGFGLTAGPGSAEPSPRFELDEPVLRGMAGAVRPGGTVLVSAFSAYFQLRFQEETDRFDADLGVNEELTTIRNEAGDEERTRLWTTCYTPRELRLLARVCGLEPLAVHGVTPGRYRAAEPVTDCHEFLLVAKRPH